MMAHCAYNGLTTENERTFTVANTSERFVELTGELIEQLQAVRKQADLSGPLRYSQEGAPYLLANLGELTMLVANAVKSPRGGWR